MACKKNPSIYEWGIFIKNDDDKSIGWLRNKTGVRCFDTKEDAETFIKISLYWINNLYVARLIYMYRNINGEKFGWKVG